MRPRLYWPVTLAAAALVGLLAYGVAATGTDTTLDSRDARGRAGRAARQRTLPRARRQRAPARWPTTSGKVVLVNFWASWCQPCRDELPLLEKTHKKLAREGGTVLGIDLKDDHGAPRSPSCTSSASPIPTCATADGSYVRKCGQTGYPGDLRDRPATAAIAAVRRCPVDAAVAGPDAAAAAAREGVTRALLAALLAASRCSPPAAASPPRRAPRCPTSRTRSCASSAARR